MKIDWCEVLTVLHLKNSGALVKLIFSSGNGWATTVGTCMCYVLAASITYVVVAQDDDMTWQVVLNLRGCCARRCAMAGRPELTWLLRKTMMCPGRSSWTYVVVVHDDDVFWRVVLNLRGCCAWRWCVLAGCPYPTWSAAPSPWSGRACGRCWIF